VFSPLYENPFGAILFEAGQIKYSLRIINALEGETFAVQFLSSTDISVKSTQPITSHKNFNSNWTLDSLWLDCWGRHENLGNNQHPPEAGREAKVHDDFH